MTSASESGEHADPVPHLTRGRGEPQHLLITLLGDYWHRQRELLPSAALVALLAEFGVNESTARQAMRRLKARGLLIQEKVGRMTFYGVPPRISEAQPTRLHTVMSFGGDFVDWDERWTVISYSIPEKERDVRRLLRNGLRAMRFGLLNDAIWLTPYDRVAQATRLLNELGVDSAAVMRSELLPRPGWRDLYADVFGLRDLSGRYHEFIARHEPTIEWAISGRMSPAEALVLRTELMNEWLTFRLTDPELPASVLPPDWPRARARSVFLQIYDHLGATAEVRFRQIVGTIDPRLANLATFHASRDIVAPR